MRKQRPKTELLVEKMPSLSTQKSEPAAPVDAAEFAKTTVTMMEKKIRNLEKRKVRISPINILFVVN